MRGLLDLENASINFFNRCLRKTNQYSTKFILQKVIRIQKKYISELKFDFQQLDAAITDKFHASEDLYADLETLFDLCTLTFLEATKISLRIAERQCSVYDKLLSNETNTFSQELLLQIIDTKKRHIKALKEEFDHLR